MKNRTTRADATRPSNRKTAAGAQRKSRRAERLALKLSRAEWALAEATQKGAKLADELAALRAEVSPDYLRSIRTMIAKVREEVTDLWIMDRSRGWPLGFALFVAGKDGNRDAARGTLARAKRDDQVCETHYRGALDRLRVVERELDAAAVGVSCPGERTKIKAMIEETAEAAL